ncbi:MAG: PrsW family intramembrane metalloprotease [Dehalococcoidales bacterium]|nr:PrsW family intramembrane metalloprotease [Dehalococcoidales bacterium]
MLEYMVDFFVSGFIYPGILWTQALLGIGLAIVFGAIWFAPYWTPILKKPWAWAVLAGSAILTWAAAAFIQIPLQFLAGQALEHFWSLEILMSWLLLTAIPQILLSGLVQEGAKLVPVVVYWWRKGRNIDPKLGLAIGAVAGAGFGIFEAAWAHNTIFAAGWSWEAVQTSGLVALAPFWERFFAVAFHTAASALAGYGLAKGWGWQFYLIASFLHAFLNYSVVALQSGLITVIQLEIFAAVWAILVTGGALWLRWRKSEAVAESISGVG